MIVAIILHYSSIQMRMRYLYFVILALITLPAGLLAQSQDTAKVRQNSPVFKDYRPPGPGQLVRPSDVVYQLWEGFVLVRQANDGDPAAQNELGLRYLVGKGFPVDTARAVYWIRRAAEQNMSIAQYNLGVFLNNGWGVKWDPFKAFDEFKAAAAQHLPDAEFAMGLCYTDNLIVDRNWDTAYHWLKAAADQKYEPARQVLLEFARRRIPVPVDSVNATAPNAVRDTSSRGAVKSFELVYINFGSDTTSHVSDLTLLNEALREGSKEIRKALGVSTLFEKGNEKNADAVSIIQKAADVGSPEALVLLGRCYQEGVGVPKDRILAAEEYLRAARMDSRHALTLLLHLVREDGFPEEVESLAKKGNNDAAFVWVGLTELGLDQRISDSQAFHLLVGAADHGNIPSLIELGRCYYTGQWTKPDPVMGRKCWLHAVALGSREAKIRLAAAAIIADSNSTDSSVADTIGILSSASNDGSLLARVALGYCYQNGIGVPQSTPEAVKLYRECAQRGSQTAYHALEAMYNRLRPSGKEFQITEQN